MIDGWTSLYYDICVYVRLMAIGVIRAFILIDLLETPVFEAADCCLLLPLNLKTDAGSFFTTDIISSAPNASTVLFKLPLSTGATLPLLLCAA
jgi:hypothetical protein